MAHVPTYTEDEERVLEAGANLDGFSDKEIADFYKKMMLINQSRKRGYFERESRLQQSAMLIGCLHGLLKDLGAMKAKARENRDKVNLGRLEVAFNDMLCEYRNNFTKYLRYAEVEWKLASKRDLNDD